MRQRDAEIVPYRIELRLAWSGLVGSDFSFERVCVTPAQERKA